MARMTFKAGDDYMLKLSRLNNRSEEIAKKAIRKAAGIVTDKIRENLEVNLRDPESAAKSGTALFKNYYNKPTGALSDSLGITPITKDKDGWWNAKVGFDGYDGRGVPNQLKARVMESGSSTIKKRPFVRPAVQATKTKAVRAMGEVVDEEIEKTMKGQ